MNSEYYTQCFFYIRVLLEIEILLSQKMQIYILYVVYIFCTTIWIRKHFAWLDFLNSVDAGYSNAGMI